MYVTVSNFIFLCFPELADYTLPTSSPGCGCGSVVTGSPVLSMLKRVCEYAGLPKGNYLYFDEIIIDKDSRKELTIFINLRTTEFKAAASCISGNIN